MKQLLGQTYSKRMKRMKKIFKKRSGNAVEWLFRPIFSSSFFFFRFVCLLSFFRASWSRGLHTHTHTHTHSHTHTHTHTHPLRVERHTERSTTEITVSGVTCHQLGGARGGAYAAKRVVGGERRRGLPRGKRVVGGERRRGLPRGKGVVGGEKGWGLSVSLSRFVGSRSRDLGRKALKVVAVSRSFFLCVRGRFAKNN